MQFATRKTSDVSLQALAARLYTLNDAPSRTAAEAALRAANPALLADFTRIPLGALIIVPDVPNVVTTSEARSPIELASAGPAVLLRALDEVIAQVATDYNAEAADAAASFANVPNVPPSDNRPNWAGYVQTIVGPGAQARQNASAAARDAAPDKFKPLQDDLAALLARLN